MTYSSKATRWKTVIHHLKGIDNALMEPAAIGQTKINNICQSRLRIITWDI